MTTDAALALRSRRVLTPSGLQPATVWVSEGRIAEIGAYDATERQAAGGRSLAGEVIDVEIVDVGDDAVLPGFVDTHVHVNEPGRTHWEGFATATRAAAAAGITTIIDMPLNSVPPTTSVAALREKQAAAEAQCSVDVGFWAGLVPGNSAELEPLVAEGVFGFKGFLVESGVDEFAAVDATTLAAGLQALADLDALAIVHAEDADVIARSADACRGVSPRRHAAWLATRPDLAEVVAVERLAELSQRLSARVHVLHVSSAQVLEVLNAARDRGAWLSAETCPHYLTFAAEDIPDGDTSFKCAPPIRDCRNRDRLWQALRGGELSMIVSDHSPSPPALKHTDSGDFLAAWGGISSLQVGPSAVWTEAARRGHDLQQLSEWMSSAPAALVGLKSKGRIAVGYDADLVVFDPEATFRVIPSELEHRHPVTPYAGRRMLGVTRATYLRGEEIYRDGRFRPGRGRLLRKDPG